MDFKAKVLVSGELDYLLPSYKVSKKFSDGFGKDTYYTLILTECEE